MGIIWSLPRARGCRGILARRIKSCKSHALDFKSELIPTCHPPGRAATVPRSRVPEVALAAHHTYGAHGK